VILHRRPTVHSVLTIHRTAFGSTVGGNHFMASPTRIETQLRVACPMRFWLVTIKAISKQTTSSATSPRGIALRNNRDRSRLVGHEITNRKQTRRPRNRSFAVARACGPEPGEEVLTGFPPLVALVSSKCRSSMRSAGAGGQQVRRQLAFWTSKRKRKATHALHSNRYPIAASDGLRADFNRVRTGILTYEW